MQKIHRAIHKLIDYTTFMASEASHNNLRYKGLVCWVVAIISSMKYDQGRINTGTINDTSQLGNV